MYSIISKRALLAVLFALGVEQVLSLPAVASTDAAIVNAGPASLTQTTSETAAASSVTVTASRTIPPSVPSASVTTAELNVPAAAEDDTDNSIGDNSANLDDDNSSEDDAVTDEDNADTSSTDEDDVDSSDSSSLTDDVGTDQDTDGTGSTPGQPDDARSLEPRGRPRPGGASGSKTAHRSSTHAASTTKSKATDQTKPTESPTADAASVTSNTSHHSTSTKPGSSTTKPTSSSRTSTSSSTAAACASGTKSKGDIRARNDNKNCGKSTKDKPKEVAFPADDTKTPGLQELFDADCYAHLCQGQPVLMSRWNKQKEVRGRGDEGNAAVAMQIFQTDKKREHYGTTKPDDLPGGFEVISPEEWCPASVAQSGRSATLIPVTREAQDAQKDLINTKFFIPNKIERHNWDPKAKKWENSDEGTWFRLTKFEGAKGPYCKKLNELLTQYNTNFNKDGILKVNKPDICTKSIAKGDMGGLHYDVGQYAYQRDLHIHDKFVFVGKKPSK